MTTRVMTFVLPLPVNLANSRMHWRVKLNAKQAFYAECDRRQAAGLLPAPPKSPWQRCVAKVTLYLGAEMDNDNAAARTKFCWDWLKTRGYIVDDKRKNVEQLGYPEQRIKRGQDYRIEIVLSHLSALEKSA